MDNAEIVYKDQREQWTKMSINNTLRMGKFSSDRTIKEYADDIWDLQPCKIPNPAATEMNRIKSETNVISAKETHAAKEAAKNEER